MVVMGTPLSRPDAYSADPGPPSGPAGRPAPAPTAWWRPPSRAGAVNGGSASRSLSRPWT